jgi:hypothetical protein
VIKRGAIIGIGTIILVIGLTGLGLLQTGVIHPTEVKSPETAPAPQSGVSSGTETGTDQAAQERQPQSGDLATEKPVPVPQVGNNGERRYPKQGQVAQSLPPNDQTLSGPAQGADTTRKPKFDEKRRQNQFKSELKRFTRNTPPAHTKQPVVIRFKFDPARYRGLNVAHVHKGDKIRVKLRRVGQVDRRVYFTFSRNINSPQGAVLKVETRLSFQRPVVYRTDRGYYVIEVKIYPGNRWNIKPRSFV